MANIATKKPKQSGSDYYNYKGFLFPGAAGPGQRRIQIPQSMWGQLDLYQMHRFCHRSDLREKVEDGTLGLQAPKPLGWGGGVEICTISSRVTTHVP